MASRASMQGLRVGVRQLLLRPQPIACRRTVSLGSFLLSSSSHPFSSSSSSSPPPPRSVDAPARSGGVPSQSSSSIPPQRAPPQQQQPRVQDFLDPNNPPTEVSTRRPRPPSTSSPSPFDDPSDPDLISSIDQLSITTGRTGATGPATISSPAALTARYKPTDRTYSPLVITPTRGSLTTLQLHRLLTMYAVGGENEREVSRLASRFEVDEGKVRRLVESLSVARLFEVGGGAGSGDGKEVEMVGVRRGRDIPQGKDVRVQGQHLVQHLLKHEERKGSAGSR